MSQYVHWGCVLRWLIESASRLRSSQISLCRILRCCCWSRGKLEVVNYGEVVDNHARLLLLGLHANWVKGTPLAILLGLAKHGSSTRSERVLPTKNGMAIVALRAALFTRASVADVVAILQNQMRGWHILYSVRFDYALGGMLGETGHRRWGLLEVLLLLLLHLLLFTSFHYQFFEVKLTILGGRSRTLELRKIIVSRLCTSWQYRSWNSDMRERGRRLWQTSWCCKADRGLEHARHETFCFI
jgi:hypothetical protein